MLKVGKLLPQQDQPTSIRKPEKVLLTLNREYLIYILEEIRLMVINESTFYFRILF
jgi:hypothetical protein